MSSMFNDPDNWPNVDPYDGTSCVQCDMRAIGTWYGQNTCGSPICNGNIDADLRSSSDERDWECAEGR